MKKITLLLLLLSYVSFSQSLVKTYYDPYTKTKLKEVYQVKPNSPTANGYYKSYDEYGNILVHRNYANNKQNGKSTTYYGIYEASLMTDEVRDKCVGKISGIFNYKNDELHGLQKRYDYSDEGNRYLKYKQIFDIGIEKESYEYYPNSILKQHNKLNGVCKGFYENGNIFEQFTLDNGVYHGQYRSWHESGELLEEGQMVDDEKDGEWIEYKKDGSIKSKQYFDQGTRIPSEEEKKIAEQKRLEEIKREEKREKLNEQKRLEAARKREAEKERIRLLEEENDLQNQINNKFDKLEFEKKRMENKYEVVDDIKSSILGETIYKFKKKHLYNAYLTVFSYIQTNLNSSELNEKNKALDLGLKLINKMNLLENQKTRDLEKSLKKVEEPQKIIEILNLKT